MGEWKDVEEGGRGRGGGVEGGREGGREGRTEGMQCVYNVQSHNLHVLRTCIFKLQYFIRTDLTFHETHTPTCMLVGFTLYEVYGPHP